MDQINGCLIFLESLQLRQIRENAGEKIDRNVVIKIIKARKLVLIHHCRKEMLLFRNSRKSANVCIHLLNFFATRRMRRKVNV